MNIDTPWKWRKGQTIFNFLWWLNKEHRYPIEFGVEGGRMADPFHIPDETLDELFNQFLKENETF